MISALSFILDVGCGGKANFEKSFLTVIGYMTVARGKKYSIMSVREN